MYKQEKKYYQKAFLVALVMAAALFTPFVIADRGVFIYFGDYNAQQIPFFKHGVEMVHNGIFGWDWQTDLGSSVFGSYTYYTLGSPFFWIMTLFPAAAAPYLMAPLLCLKYALQSLFAFVYIRRFVTKPQSALIGGILYAFSSFDLYNIFFQFQDAFIWFPLLLIALEEAVVNKRRGVFALAMAINCLANYFFFIQDCIFLIIYFTIRIVTDKNFKIKAGDFFLLLFEVITGVLIAGVIFLPSIAQVLDVPRATNTLTDWKFLFFGDEQRYGLLTEGIFLTPEIGSRNDLFPNANARWSSVALYLPLFSMSGVLAFFKNVKKHWVKIILLICLVFAYVPGLNASFTLFNDNFYTRWFYMPTLLCCLATAYVIEREDFDFSYGVKLNLIISSIILGLSLLAPFTKEVKDDDGNLISKDLVPRFMLITEPHLWTAIALTLAAMIAIGLLAVYRKKASQREFFKRTMVLSIVFSMLLGYYYFGWGRERGPKLGEYNDQINAEFSIDDPDFYRIELADSSFNNVNMLWGMSSLKSFQSIVPQSTFNFLQLLDMKRTVNTAPDSERYGIRAFSRVKYVMIDKSKETKQATMDKMMIYDYYDTQGKYDIYKTDYALPMGFAYDNYYLEADVKDNRRIDNLIIRAAILSEDQVEDYEDLLTPMDTLTLGDLSSDDFKKDAQARIDEGVDRFSINKKGFTAVCDYDTEKLVCFSVPWDKGWSAEVNGESVEIGKVNGGMCAIRVPEGYSEISFTYETPMLKYGIIASAAGVLLWGVYMMIIKLILRRKGRSYVHLYENDQLSLVKAHASYIDILSEQIFESPERGGLASSKPIEIFLFEDEPSTTVKDNKEKKDRPDNSKKNDK